MMAIAEIIEYVGAITIVRVAEIEYFPQLAPLECGSACDVVGVHPKLRCGCAVEHHDSASATRRGKL